MPLVEKVRHAAEQKILFTRHAVDQMNKPDRLISESDVREVIFSGEVIEEYAEDLRGESCLMLGWSGTKRAIHVVCAPKKEYLAVITAYVPHPGEWKSDLKTRLGGK